MHFLCQPVRSRLTLPCHQNKETTAHYKVQASNIHPQPKFSVNHLIGIDFAFISHRLHLVAAMVSRQGQLKVLLIRGLVVETHNVRKICCQFVVSIYP
jgi:hypothetical protein